MLTKQGRKSFVYHAIQLYFDYIDRLAVRLRNFSLVVHEVLDEFRTLLNSILVHAYNLFKSSMTSFYGELISSQGKSNLFVYLLRFIASLVVGVPFLIFILCLSGFVVLLGGTLASVVGLRNLGDYSPFEQILAWSMAIVLGLLLPLVVGPYLLYKICLMFIFSIIIIGLNFLFGHCGIVSLGHAAFVLTGGYLTALIYNGAFGFQPPFILAVFLSAIITSTLGLFLGAPSLRIKDEYLLIVTLSFMIAVPQIIRSHYLSEFGGATGGGIEIRKILVPQYFSSLSQSVWCYYMIAFSFFVLVGFAYNLHVKSQIGRVFALIKCDDTIALAQGVGVTRYKLLAFVISAFYAGFGGGLTMLVHPFVGSDSFSVQESIDYYIGLIIGGTGSIFGNVLGGAFLSCEEDMIKAASQLIHGGDNVMRMAYGLILVVLINFFPEGVGGIFQKYVRRKVNPQIRRGLYFMRPPPDYDYLTAKSFYEMDENKYDGT